MIYETIDARTSLNPPNCYPTPGIIAHSSYEKYKKQIYVSKQTGVYTILCSQRGLKI